MAETLTGLEHVVEAMHDPIRRYVSTIRELAGANLKAITLYGAIAGRSFDMKRHTARNVLVLERVDLEMLRRLAEQGTRLGRDRIAAPLSMTPEYIQASLDTFPLELIEIMQHHVTIVGEDQFSDLTFKDDDVRLQCERELKTVLIGLRQGLLAAAGKEKYLEVVEHDIAETILRTLRGMLWLRGEREGRSAWEVVGSAEEKLERKLPGLRRALDPAGGQAWDDFVALYDDVTALGRIADAL